jgi:hypothetical protein
MEKAHTTNFSETVPPTGYDVASALAEVRTYGVSSSSNEALETIEKALEQGLIPETALPRSGEL